MLRLRPMLLLLVLAYAPALAAQPLVLDLDPQQTEVRFGFGATLHSVQGTVRVVEGRIEVDPEAGTASGQVVLDMTSATTGNARRDRKMHQKILETDRYPRAVFRVERMTGSVRRQGASELQLHGTLDFHGSSRAVALPATAQVVGDRVTANGALSIPYVEWGLKDPSFFLLRVGKEVRVEVRAAGKLSG